MPYSATTFVSGGAPGIDSGVLNTMQTQYTESINSLNQDLFTAFVLNGLVATKDGTTASQLDVTSGVAYLLQTDSSLRRRAPSSTTFSTTGNPSTTMYLDLNPDGSWSWGTAHSAVANYLSVASVTTDASANISVVTDARTLSTTLFGAAIGALSLFSPNFSVDDSGNVTANAYSNVTIADLGSGQALQLKPSTSASNRGLSFGYRDSGGTLHTGFALGADGSVTFNGKISSDGGALSTNGSGYMTLSNVGSTSTATNFLTIKNTTNAIGQYNFFLDTSGNFGIWDQTNAKAVLVGNSLSLTIHGSSNPVTLNSDGTINSHVGGIAGNLSQMSSAGGGAYGYRMWVGTSDPTTSASEGDVWVSA